jgi:hypothetical protein
VTSGQEINATARESELTVHKRFGLKTIITEPGVRVHPWLFAEFERGLVGTYVQSLRSWFCNGKTRASAQLDLA